MVRAGKAQPVGDGKFPVIFETTLDGMLIADDAGRYLDANPAACSLLGMRRESIIGRKVEDFADPKRRQEVRKSWRRFLTEGYQRGLFRIFRPDGSTRHVDYISRAHILPHQHLSILRDITERNQAERSLRESEDRLRRAVDELRTAKDAAEAGARAKIQFVANISHEIRTPINGILGTIELLRRTRLTPEQKEYVDIMDDSGETLMSLVNEFLDFSRMEAGKLKLEIRNFDLAATLNAVLALFAERIQFKRVELVSQVPDDIPIGLRGDPVRLRQVLMNLIGNAVKFTERGKITLSVAKQREDASRVSLRFLIRDTGPGISRAAQRQLFQPFAQVDSSATRPHSGTGLGLAISKQLVELMAGTIGLQSATGQGSTFWFTLPFGKQTGSSLAPARAKVHVPADLGRRAGDDTPFVAASTQSMHNARILVAEDNRINRIVVVRQLQKLGYTADTVANGREVLEALKHREYDLILMDCQMPRMDGYQATAMIRHREKGRRTPIVAMTAHAMEEDRRKCLAAGMDDYLSKPLKLADLRVLLNKRLTRADPVNREVFEKVVPLEKKEAESIVDMYVHDTQASIGQIEKAVRKRSAQKVKDLVHSALGASRMLGMTAVAEALEKVQYSGALGEWPQAAHHLVQTRKALERSRAFWHGLRERETAC